MKQLYYITFTGRYILPNGNLSSRQVTFYVKDTCTDFQAGKQVFHKRKLMFIDSVTYEKLEGCFG